MIENFLEFMKRVDRVFDMIMLIVGCISAASFWLVGFLASPEAALLASFSVLLLGFFLLRILKALGRIKPKKDLLADDLHASN